MWYLDSWAMLDGLAFASERPADSLDASATVFLSVPDVEPIPVGRISSALRAQRAGFQDGFRDDDGNEIGLETLDQVGELVRRAYLGGGLGGVPVPEGGRPVDPLLAEPVVRPFEWKGPSGGFYYSDALDRLGPDPDLYLDYRGLQYPEVRKKILLQLYETGTATRLYPYLRAFGEATILELVRTHREQLHLPEYRELLAQWTGVLWSLGLWDGFGEYREFVDRWRLDGLGMEPAPPPARKDLLFRIPTPLRDTWDPHIHTLGHKLLLPLVVRYYFYANGELPELIPSVFCSLVIVSTPALGSAYAPRLQQADRLRLLGRAFHWLTRELPRVELPDRVEDYLTRFANGQLFTNPERRL